MATRDKVGKSDPREDTLVLEHEEIKEPRLYTVVFYNDDFTTQEFVVHILTTLFFLSSEDAHRLMLKIHLEGKTCIGEYSKDTAESKAALATSYARQNGMPLKLSAEPLAGK